MESVSKRISLKNRDDGLDPRFLTSILDTIACCLNISVSAYRVRRTGGKHEIKAVARSYQNPFIQLLRAMDQFASAELDEVASALEDQPAEGVWLPCTWLDLKGRFQTFLTPTQQVGLYLAMGPVAQRDENGIDPMAYRAIRDEICENLRDLYGTEEEFELEDRVRRFLTQRSSIDAQDHKKRSLVVTEALNSILKTEVHLSDVTSDFLESLSKAVTFWTRRRSTLKQSKSLSLYRLYQFSDVKGEGSFDLEFSRTGQDDLVFRTGPGETGGSKKMLQSEALAWGQFCDEFRTCRNFSFHEQLTLLRLWTQDEFTGVTIDTESGTERSELFNSLAKRIADICGADICVLHRYVPGESFRGGAGRQGYLDQIGYHLENDDLQGELAIEFNHIRTIGEAAPDVRQESACYRCIDETPPKPAFVSSVENGAGISTNSDLGPRSVLTVPLISRQRVWGVIELIGRKPGQLQQRIVRWVAEIARIITQPLYSQWMLYYIREMSSIAVNLDLEKEQKYENLLDTVRKLLLASSARLFLQDETETTIFRVAAHAGHSWPEGTGTEFKLSNKKSVTVQTIESGALWRAGQMGVDPFNSPVTDGGLDPLVAGGHKYVAVIPIKGASGNCFASMMITSMDNEPFPTAWNAIVETISRQLTVFLEQIHNEVIEATAARAFVAHSVKTRIDRVDQGGQRMLNMMGELYSDPYLLQQMPRFVAVAEQSIRQALPGRTLNRDTRDLINALKAAFPHLSGNTEHRDRNILLAFQDLQSHLKELRVASIVLSGGDNLEHYYYAVPETWTGTPPALRSCINQSFKPLVGRPKYEGTLSVPPMAVLDFDVRVRVPEQIVVEMLNNLLDNAFKYDFDAPSVSLKVRASNDGRSYTVEIRNLAPVLSDEEADHIKMGGRRSSYAVKRSHDGAGKGLAWCFAWAEKWDVELTYEPARASKYSDSLGPHIARITFKVWEGLKQ